MAAALRSITPIRFCFSIPAFGGMTNRGRRLRAGRWRCGERGVAVGVGTAGGIVPGAAAESPRSPREVPEAVTRGRVGLHDVERGGRQIVPETRAHGRGEIAASGYKRPERPFE